MSSALELEFCPSDFKSADELEIFYVQKFEQFSQIEKKHYTTRLPKMTQCFLNTCFIFSSQTKIGFKKILRGMDATEERKYQSRSIQCLPSFNFCFLDGHFIKRIASNSRYYNNLTIRIVQSNNPCGFFLIHFFEDKNQYSEMKLQNMNMLTSENNQYDKSMSDEVDHHKQIQTNYNNPNIRNEKQQTFRIVRQTNFNILNDAIKPVKPLETQSVENEDELDQTISKLNKKIKKFQDKQQILFTQFQTKIELIVDKLKAKYYKNKQNGIKHQQ